MAKLPQPYNPNQYDPTQGGGGQLPLGKHPVIIQSDEIKANKEGTGGMLVLELLAIDGPAKGQTMPYRLNLYNQNPTSVDIANRQLAAICHVTGQFQMGPNGDDTTVLHNIPFVVEVTMQRGSDKYHEISRIYDMNGNEPGKAPGQTQQAAQPAPAPAPAPAAGNWNTQPAPQQQQAPAPAAGTWGAPANTAAAPAPASPPWGKK